MTGGEAKRLDGLDLLDLLILSLSGTDFINKLIEAMQVSPSLWLSHSTLILFSLSFVFHDDFLAFCAARA